MTAIGVCDDCGGEVLAEGVRCAGCGADDFVGFRVVDGRPRHFRTFEALGVTDDDAGDEVDDAGDEVSSSG